MELETVKVISMNESLRGKSFDVYYEIESNNIKLCAIEDVTGITDLKDILSEQALSDIKTSLNEVLTMRRLRKIMGSFTQDEINAGFVSDAIENKKNGWSNE